MNDTQVVLICTVIGALGTVLGAWLGYSTLKRSINSDTKKDIEGNTTRNASMQFQLTYIRDGIDDIRLDIKEQNRKISGLVERVAKVEESTKSAHHRIDEIESKSK